MIDRRSLLISLAQSGELTPERSLAVRSLHEDYLRRAIVKWNTSEDTFLIAGIPVVQLKLGRRKPAQSYVQQQIDTHLLMLGMDPVPIRYLHPHLAERIELFPNWERHVYDMRAPWAHGLVPFRVSRILAHSSTSDVWKPLHQLIERGIHPYGLAENGQEFYLVDMHVNHLKALQDAWEEAIAERG